MHLSTATSFPKTLFFLTFKAFLSSFVPKCLFLSRFFLLYSTKITNFARCLLYALRTRSALVRSKFLTTSSESTENEPVSPKFTKSHYNPTAFTEKGLYMMATILKSERATQTTIAIIETFTKVRYLKRELVELHQETDTTQQSQRLKKFGEVISDIVMPDLTTTETESTLELNFFIGKLKHTVKRTKKDSHNE